MKSFSLSFFLLLVQVVYMNGQNNIDLDALPEVEDYIVVRTDHSNTDTVVLALHAGPTDMINEGTYWFFETIPTLSVVEVMQYTHLHPEVLEDTSLTLDDGIAINDTSVALVRKAVLHFNDLGKYVVLIGNSMGGFLTLEYLDDYGIEDLYKAIPMSARLKMNQEFLDAFAMNHFASFQDCVTVIVNPMQGPPENWARWRIGSAVMYNRFIDSLGGLDLTNMMFVYGTLDNVVGQLLPEEINMLNNTEASILAIPDGGHGSVKQIENLQKVLAFIRENPISGLDESNAFQVAVEMYPTILEGTLTLKTEEGGSLEIVSTLGQSMFQDEYPIGTHQVLLPNLEPGNYIAIFRTKDNKWKSQKLIIQTQ